MDNQQDDATLADMRPTIGIMNEGFPEQRARLIRDLAAKADPFTKQRLLNLTKRYEERRVPFGAVPHSLANLSSESNEQGDADRGPKR